MRNKNAHIEILFKFDKTLKLKTMKKINLLIWVLFVGILFSSCKKDKYQPVGDYGNANVTTSNTTTLNNWATDYDDGFNFGFSTILTWEVITQSVVDNGIVMVYLQDGSSWIALPYTESSDDIYVLSFNFSFQVGQIKIEVSGFDDVYNWGTSDFNGLVVKTVVISEEGRMMHPNLDYTNYNEVNKVFNLKDSKKFAREITINNLIK